MNCPTARDLLPELLDPRTPAAALPELRAHVASCPECQQELANLTRLSRTLDQPAGEPSPRLRANVFALIAAEKELVARDARRLDDSPTTPSRPGASTSLWRWIVSPLAGCALLALGFIAGTRYAPPAPAVPVADEATKRELADVRRELKKMTQVFGYSLLQQQQGPANERLREVLASANTETPNDKVLDDLISALAFDPSTNVRLRALEALYPHADHDMVRAGVLAALPREQNPLVQLELIDFVAAARDRAATPILQKISQNEQTERTVRDAAQRALAQL